VLHSSDGKKLDLSGQGLKAEAAKKICDTVLAQGKSLL
jgi:Ran GTPase-activating protein (RanGAP) involved in mRNA processing and transport